MKKNTHCFKIAINKQKFIYKRCYVLSVLLDLGGQLLLEIDLLNYNHRKFL